MGRTQVLSSNVMMLQPDSLAKEMAALLNLEGGHIILGVEDDGAVTGLSKMHKEVEQWVVNVARNNIQPPVIPYWEHIQWDKEKSIGIITLPSDSPDKPYKAKKGSAWTTYIRVGSTSREATREEEARLYQASGIMRYDRKRLGAGFGVQGFGPSTITELFPRNT